MYTLKDFEFQEFLQAEQYISQLILEQQLEINRAYNDIHPTMSSFDYATGTIYKTSLDVVDYCEYLINLKQKQMNVRDYWFKRKEVFQLAFSKLTSEEQRLYLDSININIKRKRILVKLKAEIERIVDTRKDLQRPEIVGSYAVPVIDWDKAVENMSESELLEDYYDKSEKLPGDFPDLDDPDYLLKMSIASKEKYHAILKDKSYRVE